MNKVLNTRPPGWFWAVSTVLLLWNLLGVYGYLSEIGMNEAELTEAYGATRAALYAATPWWVVSAFAIAVFAGTLGAVGLLMRRAWAKWLMIVSLVAVVVQQFWSFLLSDWPEVLTATEFILPAVVLLACIFEVWLADRGVKRGWLR